MATTEDTKATINLASGLEFYLSVTACKSGEPCTTMKDNSYEVLLTKMRGTGSSNSTSPEAQPILVQPVPAGEGEPQQTFPVEESSVEELNKKVSELEQKLEESQTRQNFLEERINQLMSFIKSIFPFFD